MVNMMLNSQVTFFSIENQEKQFQFIYRQETKYYENLQGFVYTGVMRMCVFFSLIHSLRRLLVLPQYFDFL
jgi:hypothetical protein